MSEIDPRLERAARAAFKADWPKDDWERFGANDYVPNRYRRIAKAVLATADAERDAAHNEALEKAANLVDCNCNEMCQFTPCRRQKAHAIRALKKEAPNADK